MCVNNMAPEMLCAETDPVYSNMCKAHGPNTEGLVAGLSALTHNKPALSHNRSTWRCKQNSQVNGQDWEQQHAPDACFVSLE